MFVFVFVAIVGIVVYCTLLPSCGDLGKCGCKSLGSHCLGCVFVSSVVDVHQQWCGPCRAVVSLLRKIKNELGDDLLHFATVSSE